jgi:ACS family glucarate transporter-like MFS transporter
LILALLLLISIITYIDRVNISVAARHMMPALGLTDLQMGQVFSAFVLGYALFQVPGGWLGDRWGARTVLALAVVWWSLFTALTALAPTLPTATLFGVLGSLMLVRFLIGVGEAAALPNFNRAIADWVPPHKRGLGLGITIGGIGIGAAVAPPLTAWIMVNYHWQSAFYLAGLLGLVIAGLWYWLASDPTPPAPSELGHETVPASTPWRSFARTPTVWWLIGSYTCLGYVAYVYLSWFYLYLVNVRGFNELRGAFYAAGPFLAIGLGCPLGGWVTDRLALRLGINRGRALVGGAGMLLAALAIVIGAQIESGLVAIVWLSLGAGFLYFAVAAYWSSTVDLTKPHAGTLSGLMNMGANIGGTISPTLTPWIANHFGWTAAFLVAAGLALVGGLCWCKIRPGDGLQPS